MVLKKNGLIGTFGDKKNEISNLNKKKPILLWGAGKGGLDALFVLNKNDEHVVGFIDSNPEMEGAQISGIPVYSPTYIDQIKSDFLIIISSIYHKDISDKLKQMGYQYEQHFITITEYIVEREPGGGYSLESYVDKAISALMHMKSIKD
ncbi:hypothetical protein KKA14_16760, partial [bacterium]|nr:hypothetical protein [bacterium]